MPTLWTLPLFRSIIQHGFYFNRLSFKDASGMYTPLEIDEYKTQFFDNPSADYFLLDVRTDEEFTEMRIPGAVQIPLDDLQARVDEIPQDKPVVVVCRSGMRSMMGIQVLRMSGFQQELYNLEGGTKTWAQMGHPLNRG